MLFHVLVLFFLDFVESAAKRGVTTVEYLKEQENEVVHFDGLSCPTETHRLHIFAYKCDSHDDCKGLGELCCRERGWKICRQGVLKRRKEPKHAPFLPGIPRLCPSKEAVIEILPIQNCTRDRDCTPRICCPEGRFSYCRTAVPKIDSGFYPRIMKSFKAVMAYLQCTSPPPPLLDFFPKPCKNSLDCFPNLCCQERGRKVCRPPKRSLLTHLASLTRKPSGREAEGSYADAGRRAGRNVARNAARNRLEGLSNAGGFIFDCYSESIVVTFSEKSKLPIDFD